MRRAIPLALALVLTACLLGPRFTGPVGLPPVPEGWDPDGTDQIVTYGRTADDAIDIGVEVRSAAGVSWQPGGLGTGCQAVTYPWSIRVGPAAGDRNLYEVIATSGDIAGGTTTLWMDVGPDGVTMGWGEPEWGGGAAANCG